MTLATYGVYFIGFATLSTGLLALISPSTAANLFGVALPASPPSSPLTATSFAFLTAKGARDITLGLCYLGFAYVAESRAVRVLMLVHAATGAIDAVVVWGHGGANRERKAWSDEIGTVGLVLMLAVRL